MQPISLLFQTFGRNELINNSVHDLSTEVDDSFASTIGSQQTVTLGLDHLTLIVSHILVFKEVLADIEVATFHLRCAFLMALVTIRCSKPRPKAHECYVF